MVKPFLQHHVGVFYSFCAYIYLEFYCPVVVLLCSVWWKCLDFICFSIIRKLYVKIPTIWLQGIDDHEVLLLFSSFLIFFSKFLLVVANLVIAVTYFLSPSVTANTFKLFYLPSSLCSLIRPGISVRIFLRNYDTNFLVTFEH